MDVSAWSTTSRPEDRHQVEEWLSDADRDFVSPPANGQA